MMKYIKSHGDNVDPTMKRLAEKHSLYSKKKTAKYLRKKMEDYGHPNYPANLLLILDEGSSIISSSSLIFNIESISFSSLYSINL